MVKDIKCESDGGSGYFVTLSVTNHSGLLVTSVLLTPPSGSSYTLDSQTPALPGGTLANEASVNLPATITGGKPGEKICIIVTFMTKQGCACTFDLCLVLPACCATTNKDTSKIECNKDGTYTYTTQITNNSGSPRQFIYLYPPAGVIMTPNSFTEPGGLPPGDAFQTPPIIIKGAQPGEFCFDISLHNEGMQGCCTSPQHCITLPVCK